MKKLLVTLSVLSIFSFASGQVWSSLGTGTNNWVTALVDDSSSGLLYAGGQFISADGSDADYIAKWNGVKWDSVGSGFDAPVHSLAIINGNLYAGGEFLHAEDTTATRVAVYNGISWTAMGSGLNGSVNAIAVYNGEIYAGGFSGISKWNGSTWVNLSSGIGGTNPYVSALVVYNGLLYVAGAFSMAGGLNANGIATWNGSSWATVGSGAGGMYPYIDALTVFAGSLYIGGEFDSIGGIKANGLAMWNGVQYSSVGTGVKGGPVNYSNTGIYALLSLHSILYFGGSFDTVNGNPMHFIGGWDGNSFHNLDNGTDSIVFTLGSYNGNLIVGGEFIYASEVFVNNIAQYSIPSSIQQIYSYNSTNIYPNPSNGIFTIALSHPELVSGSQTIEIYDVLGEKVLTETLRSAQGDNNINISNQPNGIYLYRVITETGELIGEGKIIVQK